MPCDAIAAGVSVLVWQTEGSDLYGQYTPDLDEYTKEPPPLPPHLRQIILNKNPPANDPAALAVPRHVVSVVSLECVQGVPVQ